jgi:hypothetical protein
MSSMTHLYGPDALAARLAALEAERLAPVPRASHAVGVNAGDLALDHVRAGVTGAWRRNQAPPAMTGDVAAAWQRLDAAVRAHAAVPAAGEAGRRG